MHDSIGEGLSSLLFTPSEIGHREDEHIDPEMKANTYTRILDFARSFILNLNFSPNRFEEKIRRKNMLMKFFACRLYQYEWTLWK